MYFSLFFLLFVSLPSILAHSLINSSGNIKKKLKSISTKQQLNLYYEAMMQLLLLLRWREREKTHNALVVKLHQNDT